MDLSEINFIKLIKSFTPKEIAEFDKFVSSPYFNTNTSMTCLYRELAKFYPDFKDNDFSKGNIFRKVFPDKVFNDTLIRKYISNLMKLAEDFLVCKDISSNPEKRMISLLDQYNKKNLTGFFERQLVKTEKNFSVNSEINVETFYYKHFREELKSNYYIRINKLHLIKQCLIRSHIYILLHTLMINTIYANMMIIVNKSFRESSDNDYFEKVNSVFDLIGHIDEFGQLDDNEKLFVELCRIDHSISRDPYDIENLKKMRTIIFRMSHILSNNLLYIFFSHLNIYYLLNSPKNYEIIKRDLFENYRFMIERGLYKIEGIEFMNYSEYRTILIYSLRIKEFDWTENFINQFKEHHEPGMKDNIYKYSMALLNYEKQDPENSLKIISELKISDAIMKIDVDVLLLLIYFDLNYTDSALSLIDSLRHYFSEIKILSRDAIDNHLNFLKYYRNVLMGKSNNNIVMDFNVLKCEVLNNTNTRRKDWLIEKIDKLIIDS